MWRHKIEISNSKSETFFRILCTTLLQYIFITTFLYLRRRNFLRFLFYPHKVTWQVTIATTTLKYVSFQAFLCVVILTWYLKYNQRYRLKNSSILPRQQVKRLASFRGKNPWRDIPYPSLLRVKCHLKVYHCHEKSTWKKWGQLCIIMTSHISQNETFTVLTFLEAAERKSKRNRSLPSWTRCLSNNQ